MSRFADPRAKEPFPLGACQCPGTPHQDGDWIALRTSLGAADVERLTQGTSLDAMELLVVDWNLLGPDGTLAPVDREHIDQLYADNFNELDVWIEKHVRMAAILPNGSAAPSRNGSQGSGSRRRTRLKAI